MVFPPPTPNQARWLWGALTTLAVLVVLAAAGLLLWVVAFLARELSSVLAPLAIAAVFAYLLDPMVDLLERRGAPRPRAILLVFFVAVMTVLILLATVVPQLVMEMQGLAKQLPGSIETLKGTLSKWLDHNPLGSMGARAREAWDSNLGATVQSWLALRVPRLTAWALNQLSVLASWVGFLAGLALVPVYVFYFLLEKRGISGKWTDYLPIQDSRWKDEAVFVLNSINDCLIVFFRGQVLVALCDGILLTIGFLCMGLHYAFLLGMVAGLLSVVPYLGVMTGILPTVILAIVQFGDWLHPALVVAIFAAVQLLEGLLITPKILGDRVGLHPLTIIISVMVGTSLMGGVLGGVLAIPFTAALRSIMFRYVWKRRTDSVSEI